jgi:hypothetical protein
MSAAARRRRFARLAAAGAAVAALALSPLLGVTGAADARADGPSSSPRFASVSQAAGDVVTSPVGGDAKPPVITSIGNSVTVTVSLWTSSAQTTAAVFTKDTDVMVTSGGVSVTRTFPAGASSQPFTTGAFTSAVNNTTVTVSFPGLTGKKSVPAASSPTRFDVLTFVTADTAGAGYTRSVGRSGADCDGKVDAQNPYCATVLLPQGAGSVVLGTGACDGTDYTDCDRATSYVFELLAELSDYSPTSPATVILSCDKLYCGQGAIKRNVPSFSSSGNGDLADLPGCPAKGVALASGACVDYVQSTRDNAGDTHLYVLFARDARMSCC